MKMASIVIADFKAATIRAVKAGYQVMEIHAAHGYLLHQFLSLSNVRTDAYGGSLKKQIRLTLEVLEAVQSEWPIALPLFVRISATVGQMEVGMQKNLYSFLYLKRKGVDLIDVSSGALVPIKRFL
jgi:2,4-dienoyl-CoA reductase-like NADH-dependent reductase (Old Yellow Enzyme family)